MTILYEGVVGEFVLHPSDCPRYLDGIVDAWLG